MNHRPIVVPLVLLLGSLFVGNGCRSPASRPDSSASFEVQGTPAGVRPPQRTDAKGALARNWIEYVAAHPRAELTPPAYPAEARASHTGPYVLYLTVTFDENGQARQIEPSWNRVSLPHPFSSSFLAAATTALESWDIEPARQVHWTRDAQGEPKYLRTEIVAATMEVKFTFEP